jgi:hypothetical protein
MLPPTTVILVGMELLQAELELLAQQVSREIVCSNFLLLKKRAVRCQTSEIKLHAVFWTVNRSTSRSTIIPYRYANLQRHIAPSK